MKYSPRTLGLFQAGGLILYVGLFASAVFCLEHFFSVHERGMPPIVGMIIFLTAFITSALSCGSIALLRPIVLLFDNQKLEAVKTIIWTIVWLIFFLAILLSIVLLFK